MIRKHGSGYYARLCASQAGHVAGVGGDTLWPPGYRGHIGLYPGGKKKRLRDMYEHALQD